MRAHIREITHLVDISWGAYMNEKLEKIVKKMSRHSSNILREYFLKFVPNEATSLRFFSYGSNMNEKKFRKDTKKAGYEFGLRNVERRVLQGYKRFLGNDSVKHGLAFTIAPSEIEQLEGICHDVPIKGLKAFLKKEGVLLDEPSYALVIVSVSDEANPVLTLRGLKRSSIANLDFRRKLQAFCYVSLSIEGAERWKVEHSDMTEVKSQLEKELCKRS